MGKKYGVILADPPWSFAVYSNKGKGRSANAHYETMTLDDIKNYPIQEYAADHCVLFMWVTDPMLEHGLEVIKSWGFTYKTIGFVWCKTKKNAIAPWYTNDFVIGTGYYTRANPEQCLLATKGYPRRRFADVRKLIVAPRREHSRKPDEVYGRIERLCSGPYLELFARNQQQGWDAIGAEVESGIQGRRWHSDAREFYQEPEADDV